ncbi:hypothetical protein ACIBHY_28585 [Nonomuraea sp. NPDC050547]|uniref:hypothetical protein n=1 Tax=Nonomuraea sp. NPDC050547 TaxID=3364368 RepID=UPI00378B4B91
MRTDTAPADTASVSILPGDAQQAGRRLHRQPEPVQPGPPARRTRVRDLRTLIDDPRIRAIRVAHAVHDLPALN